MAVILLESEHTISQRADAVLQIYLRTLAEKEIVIEDHIPKYW
jgi:hypothetical protein